MMRRFRWVPVYLLTAGLGLGLAYSVSVSVMGKAFSQSPPPPADGSLPPEFLNEIEGGVPAIAPPAAPAETSPSPPPPIESLPPEPQQQAAPPSAPEATPPIQQTLSEPSAPEAPRAETGIDGYVYDPTGRRDPFRPYRMIRTERRGPGPLIEPLQRYDLDQMNVVGILWDVRAPRALVKDSDGNLHTVVKNTKLGRNNGYIASIREGEIVVIETVEEDGKSFKRTKVLEFKK